MKFFILSALLVAVTSASPLYTALGARSGPVHPVYGDAVATRRGLRPLSLEGFSEDDNQDGFVDPIAQVVAAPVVAPVTYAAAAPIIRAPAVTYAAAAPAVTYTTSQIVSAPAVTYTASALPAAVLPGPRLAQHALLPSLLPGLPLVAAAPEEKPAEAAAVEEA